MKEQLTQCQKTLKVIGPQKTYLVLGNLLNAAAELNIDSTPMEGFNPVQFNEILGLDKLNLLP
jgi:nitroreductase